MPDMKMFAFALTFISGASLQSASAQSVATRFSAPVPAGCQLSQPARVVTSLRDLPDVAAEFRRLNLDIPDVGEKFIPFDVEDKASAGLPHRQFVRAYVFKDKIIVWYYRGGLVTNFHIAELRMQRDTMKNAPLLLRFTGRKLVGPPCAATEALLAGVVGEQRW